MSKLRVLLTIWRIWRRYPHLRLMQLLTIALRQGDDGFYLTDGQLVAQLRLTYDGRL